MALEDIGQILFVEILKMSQYPGSPFTGNIFNDLIMFFFIPTVFIILVVYMMVARVLPSAYQGLRFLLGIAAYLFIIVGGYYSMFAYLAGPYFLFLILIMGLLFYFTRHFQKTQEGGGAAPGGGSAQPHLAASSNRVQELVNFKIEEEELSKQIEIAKKLQNTQQVPPLMQRLSEVRKEIRIVEPNIKRNPIENTQYQMLKHKHHLK